MPRGTAAPSGNPGYRRKTTAHTPPSASPRSVSDADRMPDPLRLSRDLTRLRWQIRCRKLRRRDLVVALDIHDRALALMQREADAIECMLAILDPERLKRVEATTSEWRVFR